MSDIELEGRVVLVTGASSGIGRATALAFAERGATVVLAARRLANLRALGDEIERDHSTRTLCISCDVTREDDVRSAALTLEQRFGGLDVLVNNAGIGLYGPLEAITEEQLRRVFDVNVFGLWRMTRAVLPLLRARRRSQVINISSIAGHRSLPYVGGYCASKAAVNSLTEALRLELRKDKIQVLLVSPGLTASEFREHRMSAPGWAQSRPPIRRMRAEDVARAIVRASLRGRRETVLTAAGRALVYASRWAPSLVDALAGQYATLTAKRPGP